MINDEECKTFNSVISSVRIINCMLTMHGLLINYMYINFVNCFLLGIYDINSL